MVISMVKKIVEKTVKESVPRIVKSIVRQIYNNSEELKNGYGYIDYSDFLIYCQNTFGLNSSQVSDVYDEYLKLLGD